MLEDELPAGVALRYWPTHHVVKCAIRQPRAVRAQSRMSACANCIWLASITGMSWCFVLRRQSTLHSTQPQP